MKLSTKVILGLIGVSLIIAAVVFFISGKNSKSPLEEKIIEGAKGTIEQSQKDAKKELSKQDSILLLLNQLKDKEKKDSVSLNALRHDIKQLHIEKDRILTDTTVLDNDSRERFFAERYDHSPK